MEFNHKLINENKKKIWNKKKIIRKIYFEYYKLIKLYLIKGQTLEIGSGLGKIKEVIFDCITSESFLDDKIDIKENVYNLSFKDCSIENIVMLDVIHHLEYTGSAFREIKRVLKTKGRLIMIEPAMGLIPRILFYFFHHEPNGFNYKINFNEFAYKENNHNQYFSAQSIPWRLFYKNEIRNIEGFKVIKSFSFSDFRYILSGGFKYHSFYPYYLYNLINYLDVFLTFLSKSFFSARMIVVLEKK